jgi:CRP-like cAMP-binding protein
LQAIEPSSDASTNSAANSGFVKILSRLNRSQVQEIMTDHHYEAGEIIFCEGDIGDALYLIWAGHLAVVKGPVSDPTEVYIRTPGEVVGEMAILENEPRWASLVALDSVRVLRIGQAAFLALLQSQPALSLNLLSAMSARLRAVHSLNQPGIKKDQQLLRRLSSLIDENEQLLELQRVRQETSDLIVHDLRSPLNNM